VITKAHSTWTGHILLTPHTEDAKECCCFQMESQDGVYCVWNYGCDDKQKNAMKKLTFTLSHLILD
jgi:hypothetical protein